MPLQRSLKNSVHDSKQFNSNISMYAEKCFFFPNIYSGFIFKDNRILVYWRLIPK